MERLVTMPLEINLAGMPGLKTVHTKSLFELSHVRCIFEYGHPYDEARQEVIDGLATMSRALLAGVNRQISPANPIAEIFRYVLKTPKNALGEEIYTLNDLKAQEDWLIDANSEEVSGVFDISSFGGTVKRYEIQPDPERMRRYGIQLNQIVDRPRPTATSMSAAISSRRVPASKSIICRGLIGGHKDPIEHAIWKTPKKPPPICAAKSGGRCNEIRSIVIASINDKPIKSTTSWTAARCPFPMR